MEETEDTLNYSFEEYCFIQLDKLRDEISKIKVDKKSYKRWAKYRIFRRNVFEDMDSRARRHLDRQLSYSLRTLGQHIKENLIHQAQENRSSLHTPTPVSFTAGNSSKSSSRLSSELSFSSHNYVLRSRSASVASEMLEPISEVIVVSSDEELDDEEAREIQVKIEPTDANQDVTLQDITNRANLRDIEGDKNKRTFLTVENRLLNFCHDSNGVIQLKSAKNITYSSNISLQPLILHVIAKVLKMIGTDTYMTKRELYYLSLNFCRVARLKRTTQTQATSQFMTQQQSIQPGSTTQSQSHLSCRQETRKHSSSKLDRALDQICRLVGCSKVQLHILCQSKGLVYGDMKFRLRNGEKYDCLSKKDGLTLPTSQVPIVEIESNAKFILVVEKDSVFQKILNQEAASNFVKNYKVIVFTAKGYPDVTSRAFLNYLWSKLKLPMLALTDADPFGIEIVSSYKFGCYATAHEAHNLVVPQMKWLGLLPGDIKRLNLPSTRTAPLNQYDLRKLNSLLLRPYLVERPDWIQQIYIMRDLGRKAELESLDQTGEYLTKSFLPNKIKYASWI